jgi:endonuclease/exonuclease/phosphatase family metal-dependent hydrolase
MNLRVVTWNAEGMFVSGSMTRRATPLDAVATLKRLKGDIVVIPEFGMLDKITEATDVSIRGLGYERISMVYRDSRAHGSGLAILSRLPIVDSLVVPIGETKGIVSARIETPEGDIRVVGIHLDDRSERLRLVEVDEIVEYLRSLPTLPTLMMGDFNAMSQTSRFARMARGHVGHIAEELVGHATLRSVIARVREMALGSTIERIERETNLRSLDPGLKRTISARQRGLEFIPAIRLAKIDWIFASPEVKTTSYRVRGDVGSDHRPVVADISIKT